MKRMRMAAAALIAAVTLGFVSGATAQGKKPNILIYFGPFFDTKDENSTEDK